MSKAWQFWTGNAVSPAVEHCHEVRKRNREEEARHAAREEELKILGQELGAKHGLRFIGTRRDYPPGTNIPRNPKLQWIVPPKSVISLGFEVTPVGMAKWRVQQRLAEGVVLSGKNSTGWSVWLKEGELDKLTKIFKSPVLPPVEERNREQSDGTLADFGGHYRIFGATKNAQFWVIRPDGTLREPDEDRGRGYAEKYKGAEGDKRWNVVAPGELAISWWKPSTAASHEFTVNKLPVDGVTPSQIGVVRKLQEEISARFDGSTGCSDTPSPGIGKGWGLEGEKSEENAVEE